MTLNFWKPGTLGPGSSLDRVEERDAAIISAPPTDSRERLPIFKHSLSLDLASHLSADSLVGQKLLYCVENYGVSIVVGQTGCGKTTRTPFVPT